MVNGISCYGDVMANKHNQSLGYLVPLRYPCPGPVRLDFDDADSITVGRGLECTFVLPEQMFEEEENLNHNKEVSKIKILSLIIFALTRNDLGCLRNIMIVFS